jgi:hypothetical protein
VKNRPEVNDGSCRDTGEVDTVISCMTTAPTPDLAPSETYAPLGRLLAAIEVTQTADLIAIPVFEHDVTVRAALVVGHDAESADVEKAHMYCSDIK